MSDIRISIEQLEEPKRSIGKALLEFYKTMKSLERDEHRGGKQATKIVMTIEDLAKIISPSPEGKTARTAEEFLTDYYLELKLDLEKHRLRGRVTYMMRDFASQFKPTPIQPTSYQLCPKCNGDGNLGRYNSPNTYSEVPICDVCNGDKVLKIYASQLHTTQESKEVTAILGLDQPWPLKDVLAKLVESSETLLDGYNYDGHYHEEIRICVNRGKEILDILTNKQR